MTTEQELSMLVEQIKKAEKAGLHDAALFQEILTKSARLLALSDDALADEFTVSRPTVTRWKSGTNVPYPIAREFIYNRLKKLASAQLKRLKKISHSSSGDSFGGEGSKPPMAASGRY